jgi:hypothetical protein
MAVGDEKRNHADEKDRHDAERECAINAGGLLLQIDVVTFGRDDWFFDRYRFEAGRTP